MRKSASSASSSKKRLPVSGEAGAETFVHDDEVAAGGVLVPADDRDGTTAHVFLLPHWEVLVADHGVTLELDPLEHRGDDFTPRHVRG